jgi:hypothetical protein
MTRPSLEQLHSIIKFITLKLGNHDQLPLSINARRSCTYKLSRISQIGQVGAQVEPMTPGYASHFEFPWGFCIRTLDFAAVAGRCFLFKFSHIHSPVDLD